MAGSGVRKIEDESAARCAVTIVFMLITGVRCQELEYAQRSRGGALLCPLVENYYSYNRSAASGPAKWSEISQCCHGQKQSPRNLMSASATMCGHGQGVHFSYNNSRGIPGRLYNNGRYPAVVFHASNTAHLYGAPFTSTTEPYILDNIHFHFCTSPFRGSEHAIDGRFYQGEIHLVHYKDSYRSLSRAVMFEDGLVVVAIMMQTVAPYDPNVNPEMAKIINRMSHLWSIGKEYQLPIHVNVADILPRSQAFFTYAGSLTTPPCSEAVRWIILREPIYVSPREMSILGRLPSQEGGFIGDTCNDRPLQYSNTQVKTNFACTFFRWRQVFYLAPLF